MLETNNGDLSSPLVSVIVCTRNRAANILHAVRCILASDYPNFELLIVDESDDSTTVDVLAPLLKQSPCVCYLRLAAKGKAAALNHAWRRAGGEYLALTDDDCEMATDCLSRLVAAFQADPALGVIFGDVDAAHYNDAQEHIWDSRMHEAKTIHDPSDFLKIPVRRQALWLNFGIGANMAMRAAALKKIQGWDDCIGPGEKFGSGDDHNTAFRLLCAGYKLHFCPEARVVHHGVRPLTYMRHEQHRIGRGFGASYVKYLRCGVLYCGAARTLRFHLLRFGLQCLRLQRSDSGSFILGWLSGFFEGLSQPVNKKTLRFTKNKQVDATDTEMICSERV